MDGSGKKSSAIKKWRLGERATVYQLSQKILKLPTREGKADNIQEEMAVVFRFPACHPYR